MLALCIFSWVPTWAAKLSSRVALFAPDADYWPVEAWLSQIGWMASLGYEGGLFITIGRRL